MGPEDQHPWDAQDEEIRQAFAAKAAEIEQLKANIIWLESRNKALVEMRLEDKALMTELAYWIENLWPSLSWGRDDSTMGRVRKLIQRAREATR